mgnify:CR=1 FL=1
MIFYIRFFLSFCNNRDNYSIMNFFFLLISYFLFWYRFFYMYFIFNLLINAFPTDDLNTSPFIFTASKTFLASSGLLISYFCLILRITCNSTFARSYSCCVSNVNPPSEYFLSSIICASSAKLPCL